MSFSDLLACTRLKGSTLFQIESSNYMHLTNLDPNNTLKCSDHLKVLS